jgi:hypothetical protein
MAACLVSKREFRLELRDGWLTVRPAGANSRIQIPTSSDPTESHYWGSMGASLSEGLPGGQLWAWCITFRDMANMDI